GSHRLLWGKNRLFRRQFRLLPDLWPVPPGCDYTTDLLSLSSRPDAQSRIRQFRRSGRVSGKALPPPDRPVEDLTRGRDSPHPPRASAPRSRKLRPLIGTWRLTVRSPRQMARHHETTAGARRLRHSRSPSADGKRLPGRLGADDDGGVIVSDSGCPSQRVRSPGGAGPLLAGT